MRGRAICLRTELLPVMIRRDRDVLHCGRVVANVVGDFVTVPPRFRRIADGVVPRSHAKG
jgi:hypothetical protein